MRLVALSLVLAAAALSPTAAQTTPALETAFPGLSFSSPIELTHADGQPGRLFLAEKNGRIRTFENTRSATTATLMLDISALVQDSGEQGLLGLAFHPAYASNGYLYVHYSGRPDGRTVLARYTRSAADSLTADPASARVLLEVAQPFSNHNGGKLAFGPDGYLYLSLGDGGSGGDPGNRAQNTSVLLGKMLRIDVDTTSGQLPYGIPPDNPFAGTTGNEREEIYAYGIRNMFKFGFDRETGVLWGADVGQGQWEEIDWVENGRNYGWRIMEGNHCYNPSSGCNQLGLTLPVFEYNHSGGRCSVTGGTVYRGTQNPELTGEYVYADYCSGTVWALTVDSTTTTPTNRTLVEAGFGVIAFGEDAEGELYVLKQQSGASSVQRFVPTLVAGADAPSETSLALRAVGPQPFSRGTTVEATVPAGAPVRATLHDALGREVAVLFDGTAPPSSLRLAVDGSRLAAGVYLVRVATGAEAAVLRLAHTR